MTLAPVIIAERYPQSPPDVPDVPDYVPDDVPQKATQVVELYRRAGCADSTYTCARKTVTNITTQNTTRVYMHPAHPAHPAQRQYPSVFAGICNPARLPARRRKPGTCQRIARARLLFPFDSSKKNEVVA